MMTTKNKDLASSGEGVSLMESCKLAHVTLSTIEASTPPKYRPEHCLLGGGQSPPIRQQLSPCVEERPLQIS